MQGTSSNPFAGAKDVRQFGSTGDSTERKLKRRKKNRELDEGGGRVKRIDDETEKTQDLAQECMLQMQQMMGMMSKLSQDVQYISSRLDAMESRVGQMYQWFIEQNEEATPVCTPILQTPPLEFIDKEVVNPAKELFDGLLFPERECHLLSSDVEFESKLKGELERIQKQVAEQKINQKFAQAMKCCDTEGFVTEEVQAKAKSFGIAPAYATLKSPHHVNQDRFSWFSMDVKYREKMCPADFFIVLDGHGHPEEEGHASIYCSENIKGTLAKCMSVLNEEGADYTIANALKISFVLLDSMFKDYMERKHPENKRPGTTACLAMIVEGNLFIANCGDSRAILNGGCTGRAMQLSYDYKASDTHAQKTTTNRNGEIKFSSNAFRVNGFLAVTRAIGDEILRKEGVKPISPRPKIVKIDLKTLVNNREFANLILATDGYFDMVSTGQAGDSACTMTMSKKRPYDIARISVQAASYAGSRDDITVGVIPLKKYLG